MRQHGRHRKKKACRDLYEQVKREKKQEKKEYTSYIQRLTEQVSLTDDVAGELLVYLTGRHCMIVRNYSSISEYTSTRIRIKSKQCELCTEGEFLRLEYFLPEELRIIGNIEQVQFNRQKG